jgi:hypothetical protein
MSGAPEKPLPSWRNAAEANGFGILCIRGPEGERFTIGPVDSTKVATLQAQGFRIGVLVSEAEVRVQLTQAGFSEPDIEASLQLSRDWATTTVTREPGSN